MSYDLMVFAAEEAPPEREAFLAWYDEQTEWTEEHDYDDPAMSTPRLRAWFKEMIQVFPAMNGPYASDELPEDEASLTDYSIGQTIIYAAFAWSRAEQAYHHMFQLAARHRLGFFDASSDAMEVWLPDDKGGLKLAHSDDV